MAVNDKKSQIIIIKRIKKGGHGSHGGAWKIAYADFVTAMMAFFLLMWLLGSTTKGELQGIADHFSSPLKVALSGGSGSGDSSSVVQGAGEFAQPGVDRLGVQRPVGLVQAVGHRHGIEGWLRLARRLERG